MTQAFEAYKNEFEYFLSRTDEKNIFAKIVGEDIKKHEVRSLLDIGAGDGRPAFLIAKKVKTYVAVEPNPIFVKKLRAGGLQVIASPFPCDTGRQFDMALASQVLGANGQWRKMIPAMLRSLTPRGHLMIITHQSKGTEWIRFKTQLGYGSKKEHRIFGSLLAYLRTVGEVRIRSVVSRLTEQDIDPFMRSLAYVRGDGDERTRHGFLVRLRKNKSLITKQYYRRGRYVFPFKHTVITVSPKKSNIITQ